ncbi:hypothetical protein CAPTEDRAFT_192328 [Capitella teleta]|uniref:Uncharacterized protein n=1 Tax=Capitella teleta TaxID=283909 RepID=R7UBL0_CAPTE|nr:hypothetical protein CAPTEDRAFT_192328 [Capitella teleta]|eukprot:ELU03760.1 hypothetical protein CAPTEDRAFT_192328 [Capitella teleta]
MPPPKKPKTGPTRAEEFLSAAELEQLKQNRGETQLPSDLPSSPAKIPAESFSPARTDFPSPAKVAAQLPSPAESPAVPSLPAKTASVFSFSQPPPPFSRQPGPSREPARFGPVATCPAQRSFVSETAHDREHIRGRRFEEGPSACAGNRATPPPLVPSPWKMSHESFENPLNLKKVISQDSLAEQNRHIESLLSKEREKFALCGRNRRFGGSGIPQANPFPDRPPSHSAPELSFPPKSPVKDKQQRWIGHLLQSDSPKTDRSVKGLLSSPDHDQLPPPVAPSLQTCRDPQCSYSLHSSSNLHRVSQCSPHNAAFQRMAQQFASSSARSHQTVLNYLQPYNVPKFEPHSRKTPPLARHASQGLVKRFLMADEDEDIQYLRERAASKSSAIPLESPTHSDIEIVLSPQSPEHSTRSSPFEEGSENQYTGILNHAD